jgi:hypothetical protein
MSYISALQGDALEHREHGEGEVVEVGDPIVGTLPELLHAGGPSSLPVFTFGSFLLNYKTMNKY